MNSLDQDDEKLCVVCLENPKAFAFRPCGHLSLCAGYASDWEQRQLMRGNGAQSEPCPKCRGAVDSLWRIYQ